MAPARSTVSARIEAAIDALPLRPGMRVLEIGCGPGAAAREIVRRLPDVFVLGIDRSPAAIRIALAASGAAPGRLAFRVAAVEAFALAPDDAPFDLGFALRVGAFDGRHPQLFDRAVARVAAALGPGAAFYVDDGDPLRRVELGAGVA
jgi:SAM-dependent methyltransferase